MNNNTTDERVSECCDAVVELSALVLYLAGNMGLDITAAAEAVRSLCRAIDDQAERDITSQEMRSKGGE